MSIKSKSIAGFSWNSIASISQSVLSFVITAILARILGPTVFGIMGMIFIVVNFARGINQFGFSSSIIAADNLDDNKLSTLFYVNLIIGIIVSYGIYLFSGLISTAFDTPELSVYLKYISIIFLINSISFIHSSLLKKKMNFKRIYFANIISQFAYGVISVILALNNFGIWSLIYGQIVRILFKNILLLFLESWSPKFYFQLKEIKYFVKFGIYVLGENIVNYFKRNLDYILIGGILGSEALGLYTLAYKLMLIPIRKIGGIITKTFFPAFSMMESLKKLWKYYSVILESIAVISFPLMVGLWIIAPEFIRTVYGEKWVPVIALIRILCLTGIFQSLTTTVGSIFYSQQRPDISFKFNLVTVFTVGIAFYIGTFYGINGVAVAYLIHSLIAQPILWYFVMGLLKIKARSLIKVLRKPVVYTSIMILITFLFKYLLLTNFNLNNLYLLISTIFIGISSYILSIYVLDRNYWLDLYRNIVK